jgi:hypothetical protein
MTVSFRLATFNLENFDVSRGRETELERRIAVLRPILRDMAADVICLQEVDAQRASPHGQRQFLALDHLLCDTVYQSYHHAASVRPGSAMPANVHNLVILSRWPIREQRQLHHDIVAKWSWTPPAEGSSPSPSIEIEWDRPLLYAKISLPGDASTPRNLSGAATGIATVDVCENISDEVSHEFIGRRAQLREYHRHCVGWPIRRAGQGLACFGHPILKSSLR